MGTRRALAALSDWKLWHAQNLHTFLGVKVAPYLGHASADDFFIGWGRKRSGRRAERLARKNSRSFLLLEDGFLRSTGSAQQTAPLSIVTDDLGIYYDATRPSRLEQLALKQMDSHRYARARTLIQAWRSGSVSKYNDAPDPPAALTAGRYVLVVDQTCGDASIRFGWADRSTFEVMLHAALAENPHCRVVLKIHPDVVTGRKAGHFDLRKVARNPRISVIDHHIHPAKLLANAEKVYTVTSQLGFEALIWGKPVRTFGMPFYAGWGLTQDEQQAPSRRRPVSLEAIVSAALIDYPQYIDPETGTRCEVEVALAWISLQRQMQQRFAPHIVAAGFSRWKRRFVREFLAGSTIHFTAAFPAQAQSPSTIAIWGRRFDDEVAENTSTPSVLRIEDGFVRSVGLGADLIRPVSWVIDDTGIYYDATRPSGLEKILATTQFDAPLTQRAAKLRQTIVEVGLTKYNIGKSFWKRPHTTKRLILVPGQVESDASIRYGASSITSNYTLLKAVRDANADAYIVYKPHPDVIAGLRNSGVHDHLIKHVCDEVVGDISIHMIMQKVDEVHVLTSLAGFEALLRNIPVTTYGQPFYAGWGLTRDLCLTNEVRQRRARKLTLDELVAGTLILYPTYISRRTSAYTTPETAVQELKNWRNEERNHSVFCIRRALARILKKK